MKAASVFSLSVALVLSLHAGAGAQDRKPADDEAKAVARWIQALKKPEGPPEKWDAARQALGPDGPLAKAALPALLDSLDERQQEVRSRVAETLADHGPAAVPGLVRGLKRQEAAVRAGSAEALGRVRPRPTEAVPALIEALADPTADVRSRVARSIGQLRGPADKPVAALIPVLKDPDPEVRGAAAAALGKFGPKAKPAVPGLAATLKDPEEGVRAEAVGALLDIGPAAEQAVPALVEALGDNKRSNIHWTAARALGSIGPAAKPAVPALLRALRDDDRTVQREAALALGAIGPDARDAVPELLKLAKDRSNPAWSSAMTALGHIGPDAKAAVPMMTEALGSREPPYRRVRAAEALGGIGPDARDAVPALTAVARELKADSWVREAAARAVIKIDPELAARGKMETAHLNVRLGKLPEVKLAPRAAATDEQKKRIRALIAKLAETKDPDFGLSPTLTGHAFAPLPDRARWQTGLLTDHRTRTSDAFRALVEMGPVALPFLLESLEDRTPTQLTVSHNSPIGFMGLNTRLIGNPLNLAETRALTKPVAAEDNEGDDLGNRYRVKVGDVCLVAVGQIVGRPYLAVRYQPTACIVITSPIESRDVRERVRAVWSSEEPARKLFDSLLIDYTTEGIFNGESLDGWDEGSEFQIEAAVRLLYYFPGEAAPLIAARLKSIDVKDIGPMGGRLMKRDVSNGVRTREFIKAVAWCGEPAIKEALEDIAKRTDDVEIKKALSARPK